MSGESEQKSTSYQPTRCEQAILEALLNPENRLKPITELCGIIGIDRKTYYNAFGKPEFVEHYNEQVMQSVKQSVAPVIQAFEREAKRGSFQHGKVILEMAGLYVEKREVKVDNPERDLSDEMLLKRATELIGKLGLNPSILPDAKDSTEK